MPSPTSVSVIIPTHNRSDSVRVAVESALRQTHAPIEVIVVDDGSTDDTCEQLTKQYPAVTLIQQANHGVSHARNRGIESAVGEWIALLDSDDRWFANKLEVQMRALETLGESKAVRLCHCDERWIRNGRRVNPMDKHRKRGGWIFEHCLPRCAISPSAAVIHRDVFRTVGGFDETLPACEDYDLWLRLCAHEPVLYVDEQLLEKTGGHEDQLSKRYWGMDRFRLQSLASLLRTGQLSPEQHQLASSVWLERFAIYRGGVARRGRHEELTELDSRYADLLNTLEP